MLRALSSLGTAFVFLLLLASASAAQQQLPPSFTLKVNARIVFLDVTVLDKHNRPVTQGLTKDDFAVTEDHIPQTISSFEAPSEHVQSPALEVADGSSESARTEIVLDRLNSTFSDFDNSQVDLRRYLASQPPQLPSPTELMLLDNTSFEMIQAYTRDCDELLEALDHIPPALPWKLGSEWYSERLLQSITALREIALRNEGIAARKNVLWLGDGIGVNLSGLAANHEKLKWFSHDTTNALVNGRISVFVIAPSLRVSGIDIIDLEKTSFGGVKQDDPFSADIGTAPFAFQTGGTVLREGNSTDRLVTQALTYGSNFYTLTYRLPDAAPDGRFHRVFVKMRDPKLRAVTKIGYYAPDSHAPFDTRQQDMLHITSEVQSAIPLDTLTVKLAGVIRHTDAGTVELVLHLSPEHMQWQADNQGKSHADLMLAAVSLDRRREILASRFQDLPLTAGTQDADRLHQLTSNVRLTLRVPRKTSSIRVVMESAEHARAGSVEIPRSVIDAATDLPTPAPALLSRPLGPRPVPSGL